MQLILQTMKYFLQKDMYQQYGSYEGGFVVFFKVELIIWVI